MRVAFNLCTILLLGTICLQCIAEPSEDKAALLDFITSMHHSRQLNWNPSLPVCTNWTGVTCNHDNSRVIALRLPGVGLNGRIPPNTISRLSAIQILSLRSNGISGSFPPDFVKLVNLTGLYLQSNNFSGQLPLDFSVWQNLSVINLSNNAFNGSIPSSISNLTHLTALNLASNDLVGEIPDLDIPSLQVLNLSDNQLNGSVPQSLLRFPLTSFSRNNVSFVNSPSPLAAPPVGAVPGRHRKWGKISEPALLGIVIGGCLLGILAIALLLIVFCKNKGGNFSTKSNKGVEALKKGASGTHSRNNKLVFFEGRNLAFDLEDLLRASAEVLGKGTFGTSYKAALEDANTVVVKRLKEGNVAKRDFEQQMEIIGNIRHVNVAALRAYYYSKEEKLMMYDYFPQGSVAALLHGNRGEGRVPLDWETRLKIAVGSAQGIAHIHRENGGKLVHGNIKSSNIFLNPQGYGCVGDLGLATLMTPTPAPVSRTVGFRAPEVTDTRRSTQASDVYSYGVLLLELLTGKSPAHPTGSDEVVHLVRWVQSVVREEWTAEVFDIELLKYSNIEEEMVEMLQIGMSCVMRVPEQRPKMEDVVKLVEDIRRLNTKTRPSSANKSETSTPTPPPPVSDIGSSSATQ